MSKLQELAALLCLTLSGIAAQLGTTPENAQRIAEDILGSQYDYYEAKEKIDAAKRLNERTVTIKGYTFKLP